MWLAIKSKLALIVTGIISILLLYIGVLKRTALKKELSQQKSVSEAKDKSNEALAKGLENENKPTNRGYFDNTSE